MRHLTVGRVIVWDRGTYQSDRDTAEGLERGHLSFRLDADARRRPVRSQPESVLSGRTLDELS